MPKSKTVDMVEIYREVLAGKLKRFPLETWNPYKSGYDTAHRLFRYLVFDVLKWDRASFCKEINMQIIQKYKLNGAFGGLYERNIYPFISESFPEWNIQPWELEKSRVPHGYWTDENTRKAIRWLVEAKLKWDKEKVVTDLSASVFIEYNLGGMLQQKFNHSPYQAICHAYPEDEWSLKQELRGYKLTDKKAKEMREQYEKGTVSQIELARRYEVSPSNVSLILNGKSRQ